MPPPPAPSTRPRAAARHLPLPPGRPGSARSRPGRPWGLGGGQRSCDGRGAGHEAAATRRGRGRRDATSMDGRPLPAQRAVPRGSAHLKPSCPAAAAPARPGRGPWRDQGQRRVRPVRPACSAAPPARHHTAHGRSVMRALGPPRARGEYGCCKAPTATQLLSRAAGCSVQCMRCEKGGAEGRGGGGSAGGRHDMPAAPHTPGLGPAVHWLPLSASAALPSGAAPAVQRIPSDRRSWSVGRGRRAAATRGGRGNRLRRVRMWVGAAHLRVRQQRPATPHAHAVVEGFSVLVLLKRAVASGAPGDRHAFLLRTIASHLTGKAPTCKQQMASSHCDRAKPLDDHR